MLTLPVKEHTAYWKKAIFESLDLTPKHFDKIAAEFEFDKGTQDYLDLLEIVSTMESTYRTFLPVLKVAAFVEIGEKVVYPIYRIDQENELVKRGILSEDFVESDLKREMSGRGVKDLGAVMHGLLRKERI